MYFHVPLIRACFWFSNSGPGENVGGRHVAYGDGIYKSEDGGKSWKNMGLKKSEHLSKIIVHPKNQKQLEKIL